MVSNETFNEIMGGAIEGDPGDQLQLGLIYLHAKSPERNKDKAKYWILKAAMQNHPCAGPIFVQLDEAFAGDLDSLNDIGNCFVNKLDDHLTAINWYRLAAEEGHAPAQCNLGSEYHLGKSVQKDDSEALKWFRLSAAQNYSVAQFNLGTCYANGFGIQKDFEAALGWYMKAAEQGCGEAQFALGEIYRFRLHDPKEAEKWHRLAAEKGWVKSQIILAQYYEMGPRPEDVPQDLPEAAKWWRRAADKGSSLATVHLGRHYLNGSGLSQDFIEAFAWLSLAQSNGENVNQLLDRAIKKLSRAELTEAKMRFEELKSEREPF